MQRREQMTFSERLYRARNPTGSCDHQLPLHAQPRDHTAHVFGLPRRPSRTSRPAQYPEQRKHYPDNFRGSHRLTLREDGAVRCTSCFLCATACPAQCIYIEAGESPDPHIEKYPGALRDRHSAMHLLRAVRRGMPLRRDQDGHLRASAHLGFRSQGLRRDQGAVDASLDACSPRRAATATWTRCSSGTSEQDAAVYDPQRPELKTTPTATRGQALRGGAGRAAIDRHDPPRAASVSRQAANSTDDASDYRPDAARA